MRVPARVRRALGVLALAVLPTVVSCQTTRAGQGGSAALIDPAEVPAQVREEWQALVDAQARDPESSAVDEAADALLEREPPPHLRASALHAKAERQYRLGQDDPAIAYADEGLALLAGADDSESRKHRDIRAALEITLAMALTRGGDPGRALVRLDQLERAGDLERVVVRGARAVAHDRAGDTAAALAAFVAWRELLADDAPEAGYAEDRIAALAPHVERGQLESLAAAAPGPDAADCLRATLGEDPGDAAPPWVRACRPLPGRIGILLPRSGKLAVLADAHFAAAVAAVSVLGRDRPVSVLWRDSGSTAATTQSAADRLVADGAEVIIGPVGASNVRAAIAAVGDDRFLLPGESASSATGVAATLEDRTRALLDHARANGASEVIVLVPDNGYGKRVNKIESSLDKNHFKSLKFISYSSSTTTFSPILKPHLDSLSKGAALVIADALPRTELIVRQLRREQLRVRGGSVDSEGIEVLVLGTGEGFALDKIGAKHESLDGVILAPVAHPDADSRDFEDEYFAQQQRRPDDQALLVWRALEAAWSGASSTLEPRPSLVRVQGSSLVPIQAP